MSPGERLSAVIDRLQKQAGPSARLRHRAEVGDVVLQVSTSDFGELLVSMRNVGVGSSPNDLWAFEEGQRAGEWAPVTVDTHDRDLDRLAELAELAEPHWRPVDG